MRQITPDVGGTSLSGSEYLKLQTSREREKMRAVLKKRPRNENFGTLIDRVEETLKKGRGRREYPSITDGEKGAN